MRRLAVVENKFDYGGAAARYAVAFAAYELKVKPGQTEELASQIRAEPPGVREALILALDDWAFDVGYSENPKSDLSATALREIAVAADDDAWRRRYRAAVIGNNHAALRDLSAEARRLPPPPSSRPPL